MKPLRRLPVKPPAPPGEPPEMVPEKRTVVLDLTPTPFLPVPPIFGTENQPLGPEYGKVYGHPVHIPSVQTFFYWTYQRLGEAVWPAYRYAEELGVHRCTVGEWLSALGWLGYLTEDECERFDTRLACYGVRAPTPRELSVIENIEITVNRHPYDPWRDREWDSHFVNWTHPYFIDETVDTHYSAFVDEKLIHAGSRRVRSSGKLFLPVEKARLEYDHPLYWTQAVEAAPGHYRIKPVKGAVRYFQENGRPKAPPASRRREIDQACNGSTPGIRRRIGEAQAAEATPQKAQLGSWLEEDFIARCEAVARGGHNGEVPKPLRRLKPKRE